MRKKYVSKTTVSLSVTLAGGKHVRVSFNPITKGGSSYITDNEAIQAALEKHSQYGKWFKECECYQAELAAKEAAARAVEEAKEAKAEAASVLKVKTFKSLADAKDYLADTYGVSRTKLRFKAQILETGKANGLDIVIDS